MKILMIGLGSIGQRHLRNIKRVYGEEAQILAYRVRGLKRTFSDTMQIRENVSLEEEYNIKSTSGKAGYCLYHKYYKKPYSMCDRMCEGRLSSVSGETDLRQSGWDSGACKDRCGKEAESVCGLSEQVPSGHSVSETVSGRRQYRTYSFCAQCCGRTFDNDAYL